MRMPVQIKNLNYTLPHYSSLEYLSNRHTLNMRRMCPVEAMDYLA
jgi:hypothetical protein